MKKLCVVVILLGMILITAEALFAEEIELEKIVVTPSRTEESYGEAGRNIDVVTAKQIEKSQPTDLSSVLTNFTSVNISSYGGAGATENIRMRGSTAAQVLVLIDGRPVNNPRDGTVDLSTIPLDNIERVEVLHGPASSLYGANAMGGVVNIITKNPPQKGQKTEASTSFGTFRTYVEKLSHGAKIGNFGYQISGSYESSQGFRANSELSSKDWNSKLDYDLNANNKILFNAGFYKSKVGAPGSRTYPDKDNKQRVQKDFLDLNWSFKPDSSCELKAEIYNNYDRLEFLENSMDSIFDTGIGKFIHTTQTRGLDLQLNKKFFEKYQLVTGFNYVQNMNDSTSSAKNEYKVRAGYLEGQIDLLKDLKMNLGVRVDDYSNFGSQASPSAGLVYTLNPDFKLHGLFARSFRAPTFNDLYWPDDGFNKGNPDLKPETGTSGEIGIDFKPVKFLSTSLSYYYNVFDEMINWGPISVTQWRPQNIGSAVINGVEFMNKVYFLEHFEFDVGYTYLSAKDNKTNKYLIYQPQDKVDFSLAYKEPHGFALEIKGQFTANRFHNPANTIKVKPFFVLGLNASKRFASGFTYFVSIQNMLASQYQVIRDYPMPGFSITGGLKAEF